MASFTDEIVGFNPYIAQIPVDDYVRVGMVKQQQYNEGVQKVQSYIDSVAGLDVIKPEQKEYLQQRVGQLQGETSKILSEDFSNQQLVNSVGNLTNKIAGDPIVQNAVASTAKYRAENGRMKEAQEKGLNSPSNEYVFNKKVQDWLGDKDVRSSFSGEYEEYTDTKKPILEAINALKPGENITDIPYQTDEQGNYVLDKGGHRQIAYATLREKLEGVSEGRIKQAIEASMTPQMKRQFEIDGMYDYRGLDKHGLKGMADASYSDRFSKINDILQGLTTELNTAQNDPQKAAAIQRQIDQYKLGAKDLEHQYRSDVDYLDKDPESYKGALHLQDEIAKYTLGYSWSKHSLTYENNPIFQGVMKEKELSLNWAKFQEMSKYHLGELALKSRDVDVKEEALRLKYGGKGAGGGPMQLDTPIFGPIDQEKLEAVNLSTITGEVDNLQKDLDQSKLKMIGQLQGGGDWLTNVGGNLQYKDAKSKDAAEAAVKTLQESYDKDPSSVSPAAQTYFHNYSNQDGIIKNFQAIADKILKSADQTFPMGPVLKSVSPLNFKTTTGGDYSFTPQEQADLAERYQKFTAQMRREDPDSGNNFIPEADMRKFTNGLSAKERALISIYRSDNRSPESENVRNGFSNAIQAINTSAASGLSGKRSDFIQQEARRAYLQQQQQTNPIVAYKPTDKERVKAGVVQLLNDQKAAGKSNPNPLYDASDISKMIDNKNHGNTTYALHTNPDGTRSLRLSNTQITDKPREIDITDQQAASLFGSFVNEFKPIQQAIDLSKYNGVGATTDVRGLGKESAFLIPKNAQLQNYSVKYHVEEPFDGQYQLKLYIYDRNAKQWLPETYADFGGRMLTPEQITAAVSHLTDSEVDRIRKRGPGGKPSAPATYQGPDTNVDRQGVHISEENDENPQPIENDDDNQE